MDSQENYFESIGQQNDNNNNPKFWVNTSKNKYIKENCAIMSTQVTYESNHIFYSTEEYQPLPPND